MCEVCHHAFKDLAAKLHKKTHILRNIEKKVYPKIRRNFFLQILLEAASALFDVFLCVYIFEQAEVVSML